jgi:aerobic carbon-monoxide dehydrogenase medium subunit
MTLPPFSLEVPAELGEALRMLEEHGDGATLYAGGTELLLLLKLGLASVDVLIDGKRLPELRGIAVRDGELEIGAATTHREVETSPEVRRHLPALAELAARVANPRVRNVGTLGGNLCFAEPHSDPATLLIALDASVELVSPAGARRMLLGDFLEGPLQTARGETEIMTRVRIPLPEPARTRVAFERIAFHERPVANAAARVAGADVRIVVGAVAGKPTRIPAAEELARDGASAAAIADAVTAAVDPLADEHGSADYKRHLAGVAVARCLRGALASV